jgi:uncharacterized membrane protein YoaK (UPF0700 family)
VSDRWLLVLAAVAGSIDGVSYLKLGEVFTANMTGNTVLLGLAAGQANGRPPFAPWSRWRASAPAWQPEPR